MYALNTVTQNNSIKGIIRTKSSVHNLMQICTSIPLYKKKKSELRRANVPPQKDRSEVSYTFCPKCLQSFTKVSVVV